jgi:Flp pilus assembly protein TadG
MKRIATAFNLLTDRCKDRAGNVSLIFAMLAVPVIGAIGLAFDYGSVVKIKNELQATLDVATLASVSTSVSIDDLERTARKRLAAEFNRLKLLPTVTVSTDAEHGTVTATAEVTVKTMFMGVLGTGETTVNAASSAVAGAGGPMDLAIAFDTTGSMAGDKLANAQQAASDLVDLVFKMPGSNSPNPHVRVGLVPFDYYVNVGTQYRNASWISVPADYTDTGNDCSTTYAQLPVPVHVTQICDGTQDCSYDDWNDYTKPIGSYCYTHQWEGCVGSQNDPADALVPASGSNPVPGLQDTWCSAPLIRLTNDPSVVKTAISGLSAHYETYIAPGVLWGWRLLSPDPNGPFADGGPKVSTNKRLIIMTDGANTHSASYPHHYNTDVAAADAKLLEVCNNAKADGVQIYAIAFDVDDPTIINTLTQCASGPPYFYKAQTSLTWPGPSRRSVTT